MNQKAKLEESTWEETKILEKPVETERVSGSWVHPSKVDDFNPEKTRPALERHEKLQGLIALQAALIDRLEVKLQDVLLPERPSPSNGELKINSDEEPIRSTIATQHAQLVTSINGQVRKLETLLDRIDL